MPGPNNFDALPGTTELGTTSTFQQRMGPGVEIFLSIPQKKISSTFSDTEKVHTISYF